MTNCGHVKAAALQPKQSTRSVFIELWTDVVAIGVAFPVPQTYCRSPSITAKLYQGFLAGGVTNSRLRKHYHCTRSVDGNLPLLVYLEEERHVVRQGKMLLETCRSCAVLCCALHVQLDGFFESGYHARICC